MIKQEERRFKRQTSRTVGDSDRRSAVFAALLIGLILCLTNIAVILSRIEDQPSESSADYDALHSRLKVIDNVLPGADTNIHSKIRVADTEISKDKEPILQILREAGMDDIDDDTMRSLPTWTEVTRLYGDKPRIYGLESCEVFRNRSDPAEHFVGTAGTFNSGVSPREFTCFVAFSLGWYSLTLLPDQSHVRIDDSQLSHDETHGKVWTRQ